MLPGSDSSPARGVPVLDVQGLSVAYGSTVVVHSVSFQARENGLLAIVGRNGAGKSTLVNALAGLLPVLGGSVEVDGAAVELGNPQAARAAGIGVVPEGRWLWPGMPVEDNILLGLWGLRKFVGRARRAKALAEIYGRLPMLVPLRRRPAGNLSGGQQQMVAIARAIVAQPRALVLDEASFGLSPSATDAVYEVLRTIRDERAVSVVVVEQEIARVVEVSTDLAVMDRGRFVLERRVTSPSAVNLEELWRAFQGEVPAPH